MITVGNNSKTIGNANSGSGGFGRSRQFFQNNILFQNPAGDYFGTVEEPRTGTLTFDLTRAVGGAIAVIYYDNFDLQMPATWLTKGTFVPFEVNKIYLERDHNGYITANIINFQNDLPSATAPTIVVTNEGELANPPIATPPTITVTNP